MNCSVILTVTDVFVFGSSTHTRDVRNSLEMAISIHVCQSVETVVIPSEVILNEKLNKHRAEIKMNKYYNAFEKR